MSEDIFIGLDGGGTKTKLIVEDSKGNLIGNGRSGPSNISLSVNGAWHSVYDALNSALNHAKISLQDSHYNFHIGMGLAGTEIASACESFLNHPHPFKTLVLRSDAYTACIGAHEGKDGDIIIIGTGVIGFQIYNNIESQVNGWGFPHADEGGGAWLGMSVISLTLKWQDGRGERSDLLAEVFKHFNNDLYDMVAWANCAKSTQFAELVPFVLNYIEQNDENAISLIKQSANEIDKIDRALQKLSEKPLKCSLFGGIAPFIKPYLNDSLKDRLVNRKHDAAKGAIIMVKSQLKELI